MQFKVKDSVIITATGSKGTVKAATKTKDGTEKVFVSYDEKGRLVERWFLASDVKASPTETTVARATQI